MLWSEFSFSLALFVCGTLPIQCYPLVHSRGHSPIHNPGTRVVAVVSQPSANLSHQQTPPVVEYYGMWICWLSVSNNYLTAKAQQLCTRHLSISLTEKGKFTINTVTCIVVTILCTVWCEITWITDTWTHDLTTSTCHIHSKFICQSCDTVSNAADNNNVINVNYQTNYNLS